MIAVDFFAGAGGWSTGAQQAGLRIGGAVNHWWRATATFQANHPEATVICQDASLVDPAVFGRFQVLLGSPECIGHTPAHGKEKPHHDESRSTAFCVTRAAELARPEVVLVENVTQFRDWVLYSQWRSCFDALGYDVTENVLDASHFGVAQERVRLIIVATLHRRAPRIVPPLGLMRRPPSARSIIDLDAGEWSRVVDKKPKTRERVAAGRREFGREPFLIVYYSRGSGLIGRSLDRPLPTLTTKARVAIVNGDRLRMLSVDECKRGSGFPDSYVLTGNQEEQIKQLGNAVCPPVARAVVEQVMGVRALAA